MGHLGVHIGYSGVHTRHLGVRMGHLGLHMGLSWVHMCNSEVAMNQSQLQNIIKQTQVHIGHNLSNIFFILKSDFFLGNQMMPPESLKSSLCLNRKDMQS